MNIPYPMNTNPMNPLTYPIISPKGKPSRQVRLRRRRRVLRASGLSGPVPVKASQHTWTGSQDVLRQRGEHSGVITIYMVNTMYCN